MSSGVGGPAQRPVLSDGQVMQAEAITLSACCPDKIAVQDRIDDLDLRGTVRQ
ncbi:hypothetical protein ACWC9T_25295 [Kitasatospora sp. NPDC001159]